MTVIPSDDGIFFEPCFGMGFKLWPPNCVRNFEWWPYLGFKSELITKRRKRLARHKEQSAHTVKIAQHDFINLIFAWLCFEFVIYTPFPCHRLDYRIKKLEIACRGYNRKLNRYEKLRKYAYTHLRELKKQRLREQAKL